MCENGVCFSNISFKSLSSFSPCQISHLACPHTLFSHHFCSCVEQQNTSAIMLHTTFNVSRVEKPVSHSCLLPSLSCWLSCVLLCCISSGSRLYKTLYAIPRFRIAFFTSYRVLSRISRFHTRFKNIQSPLTNHIHPVSHYLPRFQASRRHLTCALSIS